MLRIFVMSYCMVLEPRKADNKPYSAIRMVRGRSGTSPFEVSEDDFPTLAAAYFMKPFFQDAEMTNFDDVSTFEYHFFGDSAVWSWSSVEK